MRPLSFALFALVPLAALASPELTVQNRRLEDGQTLGQALRAAELSDEEAQQVISALEGVFDFKKAHVGDQLRIERRQGVLDRFDLRQGALDEWQVRRDQDRFVASKRVVEVEKKVEVVDLTVDSSLYEAAIAARENPDLPLALSDVFAWDIDFYQDVRKGDHVRAVVEKFISKGRLHHYGEILAAQYVGEAVGHKRVFRYLLPDGQASYFQEDGSSARKSFLKSPLKFAHVTSSFGMRFHPVLQYLKAHNGVDYGTPVGTPVWAVADGVVEKAGNMGPNGNLVCLRHASGWETCYAHLSKIAVRQGAHVLQKQVIAYSGNTGRTTGPHLHFAMKRGGAFVNPLNQKFPRAEPLPKAELADYVEKIAPLRAELDAKTVAQANP